MKWRSGREKDVAPNKGIIPNKVVGGEGGTRFATSSNPGGFQVRARRPQAGLITNLVL